MDEEQIEDALMAIYALAGAISPNNAARGEDAAGGTVGSLTEAVMGVTAGLCRIADSVQSLACAVNDIKETP